MPDFVPQQMISRAANRAAAPLLLVAVIVVATIVVRSVSGGLIPPPADSVSAQEVARRAAITRDFPTMALARLSPAQSQAMAAAMRLPNSEQSALVADIAADRARLVSLAFFDSDAEDGDVITVQSGGLSQQLPLTKAPVVVALPAPSDGFVHVLGTSDGGGGITVGIVTANGPVPLAVLSVGQGITVPVVVGE